MAMSVQRSQDFGSVAKILNLPNPTGAQDAATKAYVDSVIEGLAWKDSCRVATQSNVNLASPGASIDSITMAAGDRVLVMNQTSTLENGIYIWNGASVAMTRSFDAAVYNDLEEAVVSVEEGTSTLTTWRQTGVNGTIGTTAVLWTSFGASIGTATTSAQGKIQLATQTEVNTGTDANKAVTPSTLAGSVNAVRKVSQAIGDGSATSYDVTHNFGTRDVQVTVYRNSGNYDEILVEVQHATTNKVTIVSDSAPASNAFQVVVWA